MRGLFEDRPDQVVQMDSQINRIPGLEGLDLIRRTVEPVDPPDARTWSDAGGAARQRRFAAG
jgi:hypothetical protein